jgi:hypothetical protein
MIVQGRSNRNGMTNIKYSTMAKIKWALDPYCWNNTSYVIDTPIMSQ